MEISNELDELYNALSNAFFELDHARTKVESLIWDFSAFLAETMPSEHGVEGEALSASSMTRLLDAIETATYVANERAAAFRDVEASVQAAIDASVGIFT
jgi:hypothetical protein